MGWEWSRLGSLSFDSADGPFGSNLKREHYTSNREVRIIQLSNIGEFGWKDSNVRYTTFAHLANISRSEAFAGDIIIAKMMPAGRAILCPTLESKYVLSSDAVRFSFSTELEKTYLYYAINSPVFLEQVYGEVQGITRVRTSLQKLRSYLLPIPPIIEQKKIVEIIDQLLTLTFNYEKAQDAINELNDHLKPLLKRSILQEAIQGRLVEQCETDEPASVLLGQIRAEKEKLAKAGQLKKSALQDSVIFKGDDNKYYEKVGSDAFDISEEIPFELPDSWKWIRFGCLVRMNIGKTPARGVTKYWENGVHNWVAISDMSDYSHIKKTKEKVSATAGDDIMGSSSPIGTLLMSFKLTVGRTSILDIEAYHNEAIISIYPYIDIDSAIRDYLFYILPIIANQGDSKDAIKGKTLNSKSLYNLLVPLPPIEEQKRITNAITKLFLLLKN